MTAMLDMLASLDLRDGETLDLRVPILRLCGDCGTSWNTSDECQWCGGLAVPLKNTILTKGGGD